MTYVALWGFLVKFAHCARLGVYGDTVRKLLSLTVHRAPEHGKPNARHNVIITKPALLCNCAYVPGTRAVKM